ncbi:MAG: integrase arm-type DNA-binding domain-containing protein [Gammaproteobacteria bacterium]|nr:integrase arm-type DNA-binding domain-containing protein [Gammaproteobacteria bacterium]
MPKLVLALTDLQVKNVKNTEANPIKLSDGGGLYLLLDVNGKKYWRMDYTRPVTKKRNTLAFGTYPEVSLSLARERRNEARRNIAQGIDPFVQKQLDAIEALSKSNDSFEAIALQWNSKQLVTDSTREKNLYFLKCAFEGFGKKPIREVLPIDVLKVCLKAEEEGHREKAHRIRTKCSQVFRYAVASTILDSDPTRDLSGALQPIKVRHHSAITDPKNVGRLLVDIENYTGQIVTRTALKIAPYVFVRPIELRMALKADFDLENRVWSYTPPKTRNQTEIQLIIPLADQVIELLKLLEPFTGNSIYVFPAMTTFHRSMSENTINQAIRRMGYDKDEMCGHGFRALARTILEEKLRYPVKLIEMQLGHQVRDVHGTAYNRTKFLKRRKKMMQKWADYLDNLKLKAT